MSFSTSRRMGCPYTASIPTRASSTTISSEIGCWNGLAESTVRWLKDRTRALLKAAGLPVRLWPVAAWPPWQQQWLDRRHLLPPLLDDDAHDTPVRCHPGLHDKAHISVLCRTRPVHLRAMSFRDFTSLVPPLACCGERPGGPFTACLAVRLAGGGRQTGLTHPQQ